MLPACLASVAGIASELIVLDTGSTDHTPHIAARHGARVYSAPWRDDFSAARNEAIERASGKWIWWMDADDRLDADNAARLRALLDNLSGGLDAYLMRCMCAGIEGMPSFEVDHVRLFRNDPRIRFAYRVHEQVAPSVLAAGGRLRSTDILVHHVGYENTDSRVRKQSRNVRLLELEAHARPLDAFSLFYRGVALLERDQTAQALVLLNTCVGLAPRSSTVARAVAVPLSEAYRREGMLLEACEAIRVARRTFPSDVDIAFAEACLALRLDDLPWAEALLSSLVCSSVGPRAIVASDPSILLFRARHVRASILYLLGRFHEAESDDFVEHLFTATAHDYLLFITQEGRCYVEKVYEIPEMGRASKGRSIANFLELKQGEKIAATIRIQGKKSDEETWTQELHIVFATRSGS